MKKLYLFLTLVSLTFSCAKNEIQKEKVLSVDSFKDSFSGVCLLGEGKGKIVFGSKRFVFSYDSIFKDNAWMLEVSVPFRGSEVFKVEKSGDKLKFSGSFYKMLKANFLSYVRTNPDYKKEDLKELLKFTTYEIFRVRKYQKKLEQNSQSYFEKWCSLTPVKFCTRSFNQTTYDVQAHRFEVVKKQDKYLLSWVNQKKAEGSNEHYKQSTFTLMSEGAESTKLLEASFYPSQCQNDSSKM